MSIIVDGYNYIGRSRSLRLNDPTARDTIISLFGQYCRKARRSLTIVFDGSYSVNLANRKRQYGRVTVIYASPMSSADDLIKNMIRERAHGQRQGLLIVTSDDDIAKCAKDHKVAWVRSEAFEQTVRRTLDAPESIDRKNIQLSPEDVQKWMEIFGASEEESTEAELPKTPRARRKIPKDTLVTPKQKTARHDEPSLKKPNAEKLDDTDRVSKKRPVPKPSNVRKPSEKAQPPAVVDRINVHLSEDDVAAWLEIFQKPQDEGDSESCTPQSHKGTKKNKTYKK